MIGAGDSIRVAVTTTLPLLSLMLPRSLLTVLTFLHQGQMALVYLLKPAQGKLLFIFIFIYKGYLHFYPAIRESSSDPTGHLLVPDLPLDSSHPVTACG